VHKTPHKLDAEATKAKNYHSRYSYVSRRIHFGTDHQCEYLAGLVDCGERRDMIFERDGGRCVDCGKKLHKDCWDTHLAHGGHTKISRCWCPENLKLKCHDCHMKNDHHGREF
jgi:hypothetical protein